MKFAKEIDRNNREAMIDFLKNHFRYDTMNGWNRSTSYANNVKIDRIGLTHEQEMKLYDIMNIDGAYDEINDKIWEFGYAHDWKWQVGFNGRSGGYLVLYKGGWKYDEHKSYCIACGQRNFKTVEKSGCKCGACGKETRKNYEKPLKQTFTYPGQSIDMYEDFEDWSDDELRARVDLVTGFDRLCDIIVEKAAYIADNFTVEEEEVLVPTTVKKLSKVS